MNTQKIEISFDKEAVWNRVAGRLSIVLDSNCWILMADEKNATACRVRDRLLCLVAAGRVFCPLSWGLLEELFKQTMHSRLLTARLMEELSLNTIFVMRTELYEWELSRSMDRLCGGVAHDSLQGLFASPAAFVGSTFNLVGDAGFSFGLETQEKIKAYIKDKLSKIGVVELAEKVGEAKLNETPPAYSAAAKNVRAEFKGDKKKLFLAEASECFCMYIKPPLLQYPLHMIAAWAQQFGSSHDEKTWTLKMLAEFPALHNYIDVMIVADTQPGRKDTNNHFFDNEILVAPFAYASVFVANDKGIKDMLQNRTGILRRTKCQYCDSLDALETWLTKNIS
jgi:hypothetical protein